MKRQISFLKLWFQICDGFFISLCWWAAVWLRFESGLAILPAPVESLQSRMYIAFQLVLIFIWWMGLALAGAYRFSRTQNFFTEVTAILKGSVLAFLLTVSATYFLARQDLSRLTLVLFFILAIFVLPLGRILLHAVLRKIRQGSGRFEEVLIVTYQNGFSTLADLFVKHKELQIRPRAFYLPTADVSEKELSQILVNLESIIKTDQIKFVVLYLTSSQAKLLNSCLDLLIALPVDIRIVPDVMQYSMLGFEVEEFDGLPMVNLNQSPIMGWSAVLKRLSDIVIATIALILFSPVMFVLAFLVKLSSRGPIFYKQERVGLEGHNFNMLKFRSMPVEVESQTGAVWASKEDQRSTWIGSLMRKTSLDELPQFINVLKGNMSCVGPRPERPVFVEKFRKEIPGYMLRHKVKAGITGWAQINGFRGNTSLQGRIEHDLYYINHWSLLLDIRILFLTLFKGFISPNAY